MPIRLHILGASGSGTSTLGRGLATSLNINHLDTDDFYWEKTEIPFTIKRSIQDRLAMLRAVFEEHDDWVLSGSLCGWGDPLISMFTHIVFLHVPWEVRLVRLQERGRSRYGEAAIAPGGYMHEINREFIEWASRYDSAGLEQRSYATHRCWLDSIPKSCTVVRIEDPSISTTSVNELSSNALEQLCL
ncbi:MAG: AAA family ATPase [Phycisphaerales bacterium]|nr:AAA family ATPase [Phycisphaerales bacterium]